MGLVQDHFTLFPSNADIITNNQVFDYNADLGLTIENTNRLTNWADQSATPVGDLYKVTGSPRRPTVIPNGNPNGNGNSIQFDGINDSMDVVGGFTFNQPETIYLVVKQITWVTSDAIIDGDTVNTMLFAQKTSSPNLRIYSGTELSLNGDLAVGSWGIVCLVFNGNNSIIRVNNNAELIGNAGNAAGSGLTIGSNALVSSGNSNVEFVRILGYDTAVHALAERNKNITALNNIYNVF